MTLFRTLENTARRYAAHGAVFHGVDCMGTWSDVYRRARAIGASLADLGGPGDRVMIASANCPQFVEILFGIWAARMVAVPVNAKLHPREIESIASDCSPVAAFLSTDISATSLPISPLTVEIGSATYSRLLASPLSPSRSDDASCDDLAWLFFTSGTTGRAKGAMLSHGNLVAMAVAHLADMEEIRPEDSLIHAAPMSHGSGLYMLPYMMRGARQVVPYSAGFDPAELLELCRMHPGAGVFLVPTMVRRLRLHLETAGAGHDLRSIIYGGGPMYLEEIRSALTVLGPVLRQIYGQGETPMTITGLRSNDLIDATDRVLSSVGWPRAGMEVRLLGSDGDDVPNGETGEIVCRGPTVMRGYWNLPAATSEALRDGWLRTGDMGCLSEDGMLTLQDRSKDVIISGGTNIYPREIEEALLGHPAVGEVCVVGATDPDWGEVVVAVVVLEEGLTASAADLDSFCLSRIARFKRPKRFIFTDALPKSAYGKVLRRDVTANMLKDQGTGV